MSVSRWVDRVQAAKPGAELLGFLVRRLSTPEKEGPPLDERHGEGVEDVFIDLAKQDEGFRNRLDETIAGYLQSGSADPANRDARPVIRGVLEIVGARSLTVSGAQVRGWLARHDATLRAEPDAILGRAALDALATAQVPGTSDGRDFWLNLWREGPKAWQWRAFIGLRLQDPKMAVEEIPELLRRLEADRIDNRPMLLGMWRQPAGRPELENWLRTTPNQEAANKVRDALKDLVPIEYRDALLENSPKPARRKLPSLALEAGAHRPWAPPP